MKSKGATELSNVDLDIKSRANLAPLVARMEKRAIVLHAHRHRGMYYATATLKRVVALGASIIVTVYPYELGGCQPAGTSQRR